MAHRTGILTLALTLITTLIPAAASAQRHQEGPRGRGGPERDLPSFLDREAVEALSLDEAQEQVLAQLRAELRADLSMMREDVDDIQSQMEELWALDAPDRDSILDLGEWLDILTASMREREVEFRLDVLEILSWEQRALLAELTLAEEGRQDRDGEGGDSGRRNRERSAHVDQDAQWSDDEGDEHRGPRWNDGEIDEHRGPRWSDDELEDDEEQDGRSGNRRGRRGGLAEQLDLDDWQRQEARALRAELREQARPIRELLRELREEMRQLWATEQPDVDAIYEVGEDLDILRGMAREQRVDYRLAMMEILTPEQRILFGAHDAQGQRPRRGAHTDR